MNKKILDAEMYPPAVAYYNRLRAFLEKDPGVKTDFDYDTKTITITTDTPIKATALSVIVDMNKIPDPDVTITFNCDGYSITDKTVEVALSGNPLFSTMRHVVIPDFSIDREFCYMNPIIVQFDNDNFGSPESLETRTAEDLAKELFNTGCISICTQPIVPNVGDV